MSDEKKRVRMSIDVDADVVDWLDERAAENLRARCREIEVILLDARKRDREALAERGA